MCESTFEFYLFSILNNAQIPIGILMFLLFGATITCFVYLVQWSTRQCKNYFIIFFILSILFGALFSLTLSDSQYNLLCASQLQDEGDYTLTFAEDSRDHTYYPVANKLPCNTKEIMAWDKYVDCIKKFDKEQARLNSHEQ